MSTSRRDEEKERKIPTTGDNGDIVNQICHQILQS